MTDLVGKKPSTTPGPWRVAHDERVVSPDGQMIAQAYGHEQAAVDATLIAAAPDLYDALVVAQKYVPEAETFDGSKRLRSNPDHALIAAALRKARGDGA